MTVEELTTKVHAILMVQTAPIFPYGITTAVGAAMGGAASAIAAALHTGGIHDGQFRPLVFALMATDHMQSAQDRAERIIKLLGEA